MRSLGIRCIASMAICVSFASAQVVQGEPATRPTELAGSSPPAANPVGKVDGPAPGLQRLIDVLQGRWSIRLAIAPYEGRPDGESAQGSEFWRPGPGGRSLIEEFESNRGGTKRIGLGLIWWDTQVGGSRAVWCFSLDENGCFALSKPGHWEADQFAFESEYERDGKRLSYREVFSDFTRDSFRQTIYEGEVGRDLRLVVTIQARRAEGNPAQ